MPDPAELEILAIVADLREQLRERYGWTHLDVSIDPAPAMTRLTGTVAVPRIAELLAAAIRERRPELAVTLTLAPMPALAWHALADDLVELWAEHPSQPKRALATELLVADGPLARLAEDGLATLVRARDGTVGWIDGGLGPAVAARPLTAPALPERPGPAVCEAARAYLGVRYQLGGTTHARIDCSGLVARAYTAALGLVLPRNSNDQLAIADGGLVCARAEGDPGDLLFLRSRATGRTHVGVLTEAGTILHASRSRDAVLDERAVEFEADAEWLRRVPLGRLVDWAQGEVGQDSVRLPRR